MRSPSPLPRTDDRVLDFLAGGGEMGERMRAHDWASSSLGPPEQWSQALRGSIRLLLNTGHPMFVFWGEQGTCFYNDAYKASIGPEQHPSALGRPAADVWIEIWATIGPQIDQVMGGRGPTWHLDHLVPITRFGKREDVYWTYSHTPIDDETVASGIGGVLVVCTETTFQVRTSRELSSERDRLTQMFEQAPTFMAMLRGPEHRFEIANPRYMQLVGHRPVVGKTVAEAIPEAVTQGFVGLLDHVYATGQAYLGKNTSFVFQPEPDGPVDHRHLNFVYQPIRDADGNITGIFVEGTDVSEQVAAHRELELVNQRLARIVQQLSEADRRQAFQLRLTDALVALTAPEDIIAAACALLGRELNVSRVVYGEVDDMERHVFIRSEWSAGNLPNVAGATKVMDDFGPDLIASLRAGETISNVDVTTDARTANYAQAYQAIGVAAEFLVPLNKQGKLRLILAFHSDVPRHWTADEMTIGTDMADRTWLAVDAARTQAELRAERDTSRAIFDSMAEGFALINPNWDILQINDIGAKLGQRSVAECVGRNHWDAVPELIGTEVEALYRRVQDTGIAGTVEHLYLGPAGTQVWIEIRAFQLADKRLAVFSRDITARKTIEEELSEANRRKDEFLAMLAHELRNPLAPISAAANLLGMEQLDKAYIKKSADIIARQVKHMTTIVDDLLDVSRVTRGIIVLDRIALDIKHIVTDAVEQARPLLEGRGHSFSVHFPPETAYVLGDQKRLVQVVSNLLNNAAKYTPEKGQIVLRLSVDADEVAVSVIDNGIGMSAEMTTRSFELFAQAVRTPDRQLGGLGLGLALVKSLCEMHGGTVTANSDGLDTGTRFTVTLPRTLDVPGHGHCDTSGDQGARAHKRVLIVDDNVDAADMLAMFLIALGHQVIVEHSAAGGLERAYNEVPDIVLLDIGLPGMSGIEVARQLRAQAVTQHIVLAAVTGYGQASDRLETAEAGFDHHFVKPLALEELTELLATLH